MDIPTNLFPENELLKQDLDLSSTQFDLLFDLQRSIVDKLAFSAEPDQPQSFTFEGTTYHHIPNTITFYTDLAANPITVAALVKKYCPDELGKYRRRIDPPEKFYLFSPSLRAKISRCAQLNYLRPPVTPTVAAFQDLFLYLSTSEMVGDAYWFSREFSPSLYAAQYDPALATALHIYYNRPQTITEVPIAGAAIVTLLPLPDSISAIISHSHSLQDRLNAVCNLLWFERTKETDRPLTFKQLLADGLRELYTYNNTYLSLPAGLATSVGKFVRTYLTSIMSFGATVQPPIPLINEPEFLPSELITFPYADFHFFEESSGLQIDQRVANGVSTLIGVLADKLGNIDADTVITHKGFPRINNANFTHGSRHGLLIRTGHGKYLASPELLEVIYDRREN